MLSEIPGLAAAVLIQTVCFYLTLLFMSSSLHKASDFEGFVKSINNHDILPIALSRSIAWAFLVLEISVIIGLLFNNEIRHYSLMLAVALLLVYTSSLSVNLVRGRSDMDCGCHYGKRKVSLSWWLVARNISLVTLALILLISSDHGVQHWLNYFAAAVCAIAVWMVGMTINLQIETNRLLFELRNHHV